MKEYFAAMDSARLAAQISSKVSGYSTYLEASGLKKRWAKSFNLYYGKHFNVGNMGSGDGIRQGGKDGELSLLSLNHFRNLMKHILVMTTSQKPSFDTQAVNSDADSLQQARLGNNILNYYVKEKRMGRYIKTATEQSLVFGKGFVMPTWEPSLGKPYTVEQQEVDGEIKEKVIYEGDIELACLDPYSVILDQSEQDFTKIQYFTAILYKNRYDLAARYPEHEQSILSVESKADLDNKSSITSNENFSDTALIPVYAFYHKKTEAMKNGRYMLSLSDDTVLYDGPIPYNRLPLFRIVPGEIWGTTEGYTDAFDLIGVQEAMNSLISSAFSNNTAFGVQNVLVPEGCNLTAEHLSNNLTFLKYNAQVGKPEPLQLTATPAELYNLFSLLERTGETLSGVNSVARGNPETSLKSGVALGLVQSMAIQFSSGIQQSWAELNEDVGSFILELLQTFAQTERMISIAGKSNRGQMTAFTGKDLNKIQRVTVELGNPMARTTAGRTEIADNLLQKGLVKNAQEYLTVIETGQLEPLTKSTDAELGLIHMENEKLLEGKPVRAIITDTHQLHVQEHMANLSDPDVRNNPQLTEVTLNHVMEHIDLARNMDPFIAQMTGQPVPPPPPSPEVGGAPQMMPPMPENPNPPLPNMQDLPTSVPPAQAQPM